MSDKSGHSIGYAMLAGVSAARARRAAACEESPGRPASIAIVLATLYGVSDEFHQLFVPGRSADRYDVLADCVGATIGVAIGWLGGAARRWGILGSSS